MLPNRRFARSAPSAGPSHARVGYRGPLPFAGDLRAWDALIRGSGWRCGVEAETRPRDLQALERRLALKLRDGAVDMLVLLLLDSRYNRALVRERADALHVGGSRSRSGHSSSSVLASHRAEAP